jgi:photosystem II stability/assembly factor-like uncharacterized protein
LRFLAIPKGIVAGQPFDVAAAVEDASGKPADIPGDVALELLRPPSSTAKLGGTTRVAAAQGVAVFRGVLIDAAAPAVALRASTAALSGTSDPFDVAPRPKEGDDATKGWQRIGFAGGAILEVTSPPGTRGVAFAATVRGIFQTSDAARTWSRCAMAGAPLELADGLVARSGKELWASFGRTGLWVSHDGCATGIEGNEGIEKKVHGYDSHRIERQAGRILASAWDQTYRRIDADNRWERLPDPRKPNPIIGFALAPSAPSIAYGYTAGHSLFTSQDGGLSWELGGAVQSQAFGPSGAIAVHPSDPNVALVADGRIHRTANGGHTLFPVSPFGVKRVFFDRNDGAIAYATLAAGDPLAPKGVLRSADGGRTWATSNSGIPNPEISSTSLAADETEPAVLYLGLAAAPDTGAGVYRSSSRGLTWERASSGIEVAGISAIASNASGSTVYAATTDGFVYVSTDGGQTWAQLAVLGPIRALSVDPADHGVIVAATSTGMSRSADGGASWTSSGRAATVVWHHPSLRGLVLAGGEGVQRSTDGGRTWSAATAPIAFFKGFAADTVSGRLFASATINYKIMGGFFVSDDAGATWTRTDGPQGTLVPDGAPHPVLYVVTMAGTIERSADGGTRWTNILDRPTSRLAVSTSDRRTLYAARSAFCPDSAWDLWGCLRSGGEVLRSDDGGATWSATQDSFSGELAGTAWTSPVDPALVLIGTRDGGLFRSTDRGR